MVPVFTAAEFLTFTYPFFTVTIGPVAVYEPTAELSFVDVALNTGFLAQDIEVSLPNVWINPVSCFFHVGTLAHFGKTIALLK